METKRFVVFTGLWPEDTAPKSLPKKKPEDFVVCADSGYILCSLAGIKPDAVIGDFDSLPAGIVREIESLGIECIVHPIEKDDTDTMLCVKYGLAKGFDNFLIVGGIGGDFGHTMANIQTLSFLKDMGCAAEIVTEKERLFMADGGMSGTSDEAKPAAASTFSGRPGAKFSLISYTERCSGVSIENAKYGLSGAVLTQSYPVGVRNEFMNTEPVVVTVHSGRLLIVTDK